MKISIRTILIAASIVLITLIGGVFFFFQTQTSNTEPSQNSGLFGNLFPFVTNNNTPSNGSVNDPTDQTSDRSVPILRQITDNPVSGAFIYLNEDKKPTIRYIEKENGNIYEVPADSYNSTRVTNTTIPGIYEAIWIDENNIVLRYFSDGEIETFYAKLKSQATEQSLNGSFVSSWNKTSFDTISKNFFSSFEGTSGSTLTFGKIDGTPRSILVSPIKSWVPLQTEKGFFVQTAPNSSAPGSLFEIKSGELNKIISNFSSLLVNMQPSGKYALASFVENSTSVLGKIDLSRKTISELPVSTLSSKCVWGNSSLIFCGVPLNIPANVPEVWNSGEYYFDDSIWKVNVESETSNFLVDPLSEVNQQIDVWQPMVDETESYMVFINKRDLTLWSLRLKDVAPETTNQGE